MTKDGPFCGCFGSPRGRQPLPPRPRSAPEKGTKLQAATIEDSEDWRIGSHVTQTLQPQTSPPPLSPGMPVDAIHGVMLSANEKVHQTQHVTRPQLKAHTPQQLNLLGCRLSAGVVPQVLVASSFSAPAWMMVCLKFCVHEANT